MNARKTINGMLSALLVSVSAGFATASRAAETAYDWNDDSAGTASAQTIILKCLDDQEDGDRYQCIPKAIVICVTQYDNGSQNQMAVNTCNGYSAWAWENILDDVYNRLIKSGRAPKDIDKSQSMWSAWSKLDCETISNYDGTRAAMDSAYCTTKHAAERVFDLCL